MPPASLLDKARDADRDELLRRQWPLTKLSFEAGPSGLACLLVVYRNFMRRFDMRGSLNNMRDFESQLSGLDKTIWEFLWRDHSDQDTEEYRVEAGHLLAELESAFGDLSFETLAKKVLKPEELDTYTLPQELIEGWDIQEWDGAKIKGKNFNTLVAKRHDMTVMSTCEDVTFESRMGGRAPLIQRVLYKATDEHPEAYQELRYFEVPDVMDGQDMSRTLTTAKFGLFAAVRLRKSPEERDVVHIYDRNGEWILLSPPSGIYHPTDWSLTDADRDFMLFYSKGYRIDEKHLLDDVSRRRANRWKENTGGVAEAEEKFKHRLQGNRGERVPAGPGQLSGSAQSGSAQSGSAQSGSAAAQLASRVRHLENRRRRIWETKALESRDGAHMGSFQAIPRDCRRPARHLRDGHKNIRRHGVEAPEVRRASRLADGKMTLIQVIAKESRQAAHVLTGHSGSGETSNPIVATTCREGPLGTILVGNTKTAVVATSGVTLGNREEGQETHQTAVARGGEVILYFASIAWKQTVLVS
ncbi:hypothetical protein V8F06_003401 [Rhypophila decipiens]